MRLKLYRAPNLTEAMHSVRAELGPDALILSTRRVGDGVEVTAALEPGEVAEAPSVQPGQVVREAARLATLAWHGVPLALAEPLRAGPLDTALARHFRFAPLLLQPGDPPLLLVGAPGAGKTLTAARLATRMVMAGTAPMVITADGRRAGATEQLAAFTRLLGINLIVASHPVMLARALARRQGGAPVLIDGPGIDVFDPAQREESMALAATADASVVAVMPAGQDPNEAADQGQALSEAGASLLVATRLDMARRLGGVLAAAASGQLALAEAGVGPGAADGLEALTPAFLAERLLAPPGLPLPAVPLERALPRPDRPDANRRVAGTAASGAASEGRPIA